MKMRIGTWLDLSDEFINDKNNLHNNSMLKRELHCSLEKFEARWRFERNNNNILE